MKYLKVFDTHSNYQAYITGSDKILPNVSHCVNESEIHYNDSFKNKYLTLKAASNTAMNVYFNWAVVDHEEDTQHEHDGIDTFPEGHEPEYSIDGGKTWNKFPNSNGLWVWHGTETVVCPAGAEMLIKAEMNQYYTMTDMYYGYFWGDDNPTCGSFEIGSDEAFEVSGNILSLVYGDNFKNYSNITNSLVNFYKLFVGGNVVNAQDLYLDFTQNVNTDLDKLSGIFYEMFQGSNIEVAPKKFPKTLWDDRSFEGMFDGCTSLITPPSELPATILTNNCYMDMFRGCSSLTTTPKLPAMTLAEYCYYRMFQNCTGLTSAPILPATTMQSYCYGYMFRGCTGLTIPPQLPATTLATYCYYYMFYQCTGLTTIPDLPATTMQNYCYGTMFYGCTGLTDLSEKEISGTTLANNCYQNMFYQCTNMTKAPVLPALTLVSNCYNQMFRSCSKLSWVKAMFTTTPSTSYTNNWLNGVASTGTFVKNSAATWTTTGVNGIPSGWTVETANE